MPTFPNARYVFSKPDVDYFQKLDPDPQTAPAEFGTFRECVLPIVEAGHADLVTGPHRLNDHHRDRAGAGPFARTCGVQARKRRRSTRPSSAMCSIICCRSIYPHWNFPKNSDAEQARVSRRLVLEHCASKGALVLPGHVGAPFAGCIEATAKGFKPRF